ncbi:MAG: 50S ribosomal protein L18 [bacterium]|nr:50S ribosomal protein L18 [bacterium]
MIRKESRNSMRQIRHARIRKQVSGTKEIPRLCVYRSNLNIYAQLIDDENNITLASASSLNIKGNNIEVATKVGELIAEEAKKLKIKKVVFDRGGYLYHGRVKALADAARDKGLEF